MRKTSCEGIWFNSSCLVDLEPSKTSTPGCSAWYNKVTDRYRKREEESLDGIVYEDEHGMLLSRNPAGRFQHSGNRTPCGSSFGRTLRRLEELPAEQRDVFIKTNWTGNVLQEISDKTGVNIKTLISRKRYAVQHLRRRLAACMRSCWN